MGKLTIGCFASLVGSMNLDFAVKLSGLQQWKRGIKSTSGSPATEQ